MKNWIQSTFTLLVLSLSPFVAPAQDTLRWWNPVQSTFPVLEGQAWPQEVKAYFDRLPARAEAEVRKPVWDLSTQSAGLMLRFRSNASQIKVRYVTTTSRQGLPHMPATGVSGLDLYAISSDGDWRWCAGKYAFADTIEYTFRNLEPTDTYHPLGREYRLYLPLYNGVKWLEIGTPESTLFTPLPVRPDQPVVVYGTSIMQGACASRPGLAWTAILGRKLDHPLINLGFSGNGRLEKEVYTLLGEIETKAYVLDCLPNLTPMADTFPQKVHNRVLETVRYLRQKRPTTPIVLAEHAGYTDEALNATSRRLSVNANKVLQAAFAQLRAEGVQGLYLIPKVAFGQDIETMVDGTHPNDLGMMRYAEGYEKYLRDILHEPIGTFSTTQPRPQLRELARYDWEERHRQILTLNQQDPPQVVLIGNSITHFWGGEPRAHTRRGADSFESTFGRTGVRNLGYGWDRLENVLWRVYHGELDGYAARQIYVMIGTNNLHLNSDEEILAGWRLLIEGIRQRQPTSTLTMVGIYPRRQEEKRVRELNTKLAQLAQQTGVKYLDAGKVLLKPDGSLDESLFSDGLHPNEEGYRQLGKMFK
ncbi:lysophospholipase L1-like esterase [Rhabdobacter roseus]|uniref:Lysophospholipase L1-like esterase n=1 Tax=Rhabdobacter roseus TaxID=1655419 RepID=A0A840TKC4_9BACT|nr:SGNH/GDSL hydrolase family protein [Rhabdobacter roseus]MBB5283911.1 lysophospholipase L1-like esterase [Rhabdobacter roseus]